MAAHHELTARNVIGHSQMAPIIISRPASMRLAIAISPSRDSSSTLPISRKYMRTGSSVRPRSVSSVVVVPDSRSSAGAGWVSSPSSPSMRLMPISETIANTSSICSEDTFSGGRVVLSSS